MESAAFKLACTNPYDNSSFSQPDKKVFMPFHTIAYSTHFFPTKRYSKPSLINSKNIKHLVEHIRNPSDTKSALKNTKNNKMSRSTLSFRTDIKTEYRDKNEIDKTSLTDESVKINRKPIRGQAPMASLPNGIYGPKTKIRIQDCSNKYQGSP